MLARILFVLMVATATALSAPPAETRSAADLWRTGRKAFNDGIYDVAERQLRALLQHHPKFESAEEATLLLGEALVLSGQKDAAVQWLAEAVAKYPAGKFTDALVYWQGEALTNAERWTDAEACYRRMIEMFPGSRYVAQAHYGQGYALFAQKKLDPADEAFNAAITKGGGPEHLQGDAQVMRARIALARKQYSMADQQLATLAERHADNRVGVSALYWLGQSQREQSRPEAAVVTYEKIMAVKGSALSPKVRAQTCLALGEVRLTLQRWAPAAEAFRQAFEHAAMEEVRPETATAIKRQAAVHLSELTRQLGKPEQVIAQFREFVDRHPNEALTTPVLLKLAELLTETKRHEEALGIYQRLLSQFPQSPEVPSAMSGAGWALLALGRNPEAAQVFTQITNTSKDALLLSTSWFKLGDLAFGNKEFAKAADLYQRAYDTLPQGPHAADALGQLALAAARCGQMDRSAATMEKFLAQFPAHARGDESRLQLGQSYVAQKKYDQAWQTFEKLWQPRADGALSPLAAQARLGAAAARQAAGQWREAVKAYEALLAMKPPGELSALATFERGRCLALAGDEAAARAAFEEVTRQYGEAAQAAEAVFWLAQQRFNNKEWAEAQKMFATVAHKWPSHPLADSAILWAARAAFNRQAYKEARDILETLLKNPAYRDSRWRADARMLEAETLVEENKFAEALLVFESVPRDFPDSALADAALGRVGDCHYSLATEDPANPKLERYPQAILAYQQVLNSLRVDRTMKIRARYKIGKCFEKLGRAEALDRYLEIIYETDEKGKTVAEPSLFCWAGLDAGELLENQQRWEEAAKVYLRLIQAGFTCSEGARQRLKKLQDEHPEWTAPKARP